ncbi:MAG TPA: hypothetical protein VHJ38_14280, partial [Nitrososphaeraceae archaeon]|nr:hypothetical protein [Nitrososphaeraceae archaeon]
EIIQKFVKDIKHNYIKLELNHKYEKSKIVVSTNNITNWTKFHTIIEKELNYKGVYDIEDRRLIQNTIDDNHEHILGITYDHDDNNYNNNLEEEKTEREFVVYKYSQMGKGPLHETVIVDGLPFFIKYNHNLNTFELVKKIKENSRILRPPNIEEYPYTPYSFDSNEELHFFMQKAREITLDELYKYSKTIFLKYVDQDKYIITLLAADSIWTYFQDLFPITHYGEGVGTNDVGKSSIGYTFEYAGYRVIKGTAISGANYGRVLGNIEPGQCTIIEDEGDNISEDTEKVKILKAGYEYNSKIPKINMNSRNQEQKWYFPYCYKMILAEKSLKEYKVPGLVDRTFSFPCRPGKVKYSIKEVVSQNINKSARLQKLYDELLSFRKLMLCYRLVHYKDLLPEIETGLKNRDNELCKPLLQLFYGTKALQEIIPTMEQFIKKRRTRKGNSLEAAIYPIIKNNVFSEAGLDSSENTYSELKEKKTYVKVPFINIWKDIIGKDRFKAEIDGEYNENKSKYAYETMEYGTLYINSLPTVIRNQFTADIKKESYGKALIFDVEKLERFEDLYSSNQLKEDNVKIEVKLIPAKNDDYDDYDEFIGVYTNISEKKYDDNRNNQGEKENFNEGITERETELPKQKNNKIDIDTLQKSSQSSQSSVMNNEDEI